MLWTRIKSGPSPATGKQGIIADQVRGDGQRSLARKPFIASAVAFGSSIIGTWPTCSNTCACAPVMPASRTETQLTSISRSWRPQRISVGARTSPSRSLSGWSRISDAITQKRSEEHTSELQSLMRISYAVFCLKQKKQKIQEEEPH